LSASPSGQHGATASLALVFGVVALFAFVLGAVSEPLRWLVMVGLLAAAMSLVIGVRSRNRPDVPISED
jgi:hypothetical protein